MFSEFNFYIRDVSGKIINRLINVESADIIERLNDPGSWTLKSRTKEQCPFTEGNGIIVTKNGEAYYSGVFTELREEYDAYSRLYTWTAKGAGDLDYLTRRVCYPDPATGSTTTDAYYEDSGSLGEVVARIIDKNLGVDAMLVRKEPLIAQTVVVDAGTSVSVALRFETILTAITPLLDSQGYNIRAEWDEDTKKIVYKILSGADNTSVMVFSTAYNSILSTEYDVKVPEGNYVIMGGKGEDTDRPFAYASDDTSISNWGRIEYYQDARSVEETDLQTEANTTLIGLSEENVGFSAVLNSADYQAQYKKSWNIGDYVAVFVHGKKFIQRVMQVETNLAYGEETITPTVGTIRQGQLMTIFDRLKRLRADVTQLQGIGN